jgi:hypothetical protein
MMTVAGVGARRPKGAVRKRRRPTACTWSLVRHQGQVTQTFDLLAIWDAWQARCSVCPPSVWEDPLAH